MKMRAIRVREFGEPEVMKLEEVERPEPGEGQVLVRVAAAGVNPVETYIRSGTYALRPELPWTPGFDGAGVVEVVGKGVKGLESGQRVFFGRAVTGSYAEFSLVAAKDVHPLFERISFEQGAALAVPYGTAFHALFQRGEASFGETLLIHGGTGAVGLAALQFAKASELRVLATGGSEEGRALLRQLGVDAVFDHHAENYAQEIREFLDGTSIDLILEMLANVNLQRDLELIGDEGRIVVIGSRGRIEIEPRLIMAHRADLRGVVLLKATDAEMREAYSQTVAGLENGTLYPEIQETIPLANAARAHETVMKGRSLGKVVLGVQEL